MSLPTRLLKSLFHRVEMRLQVVNAQRPRKISLIPARKQLGHVPEVAQTVVDRSRCKHEERLRPDRLVEQIVKLVVARRLNALVGVPPATRIAEVVRLVDDHDIGKLRDTTEAFGKITFSV